MRLINIAKRELGYRAQRGPTAVVADPSTDEPLALLSFLYAALQMHLRPNHETSAGRRRRPRRRASLPFTVSMIFALPSTLLRETACLCNDIRRKVKDKGPIVKRWRKRNGASNEGSRTLDARRRCRPSRVPSRNPGFRKANPPGTLSPRKRIRRVLSSRLTAS